ncbi:MAG: hypothetical protein A3F31_01885 [Candidatus Levybacteria bacterium RIFCSPHIGHO2_12_FULL_38_12]|nr:MAG: hypothetical protein A3F31_01885 [Candidatus Levybacteria bacterium RIFCSPHIGHO2_12_FULL_38_12]
MTKKEIKKLALASYKGKNLDKKTVSRIVPLLSRKDIKTYINMIKLLEKKKTIIISVPGKNIKATKQFQKLYPDKKIVYEFDPALIAGIKITDNDILYELNLKHTLDNIKQYASEQVL